ncbi:class A beta-lactamase-related serine hydrolase [Clostridium sp. CS001]|uniref:serine hydrolase n=1 Tax=Clostridium sp. CS001 TaxID=2880648 RepID=UPI001CF4805E|nr:serine hydrolase [Clostridium sp. CS001]MCB2290012.1 class A beta-lactamase-related serine hydrolase [Clostridium sp. CS001]
MEIKKTAISLVVIMAFFSTLLISRQKVEASGDVPAVSYIFNNNQAKVQEPHEADNEDIMYEHLMEYKQSKIKEKVEEKSKLENLVSLEKQIRGYLGDNVNKFGLIYYDINSKKSIEINADNQFSAASTIKVPINMLMYDMIQEKKIDINEKLKYEDVDFEEGAGVLQGSDLSNPIAIKTLSDYSIRYSDNIAINMILRKVGDKNRYNFIESVVGHPIIHEGNNITPRDSFKILERLYLNPKNNEYYATLIETMKKTEFHDRIDKYIPQEVVAHKIGDYAEYVNDIGIVFKKNPYILVVFTKDIPDANEVIGQVSKIIYDNQK